MVFLCDGRLFLLVESRGRQPTPKTAPLVYLELACVDAGTVKLHIAIDHSV